MTELDPAPSGALIDGRTSTASDGLVLDSPSAVYPVDHQQAGSAIPIEPGKAIELQSKASIFAGELSALVPGSPDFAQKVASITSMGERDMRAAGKASRRMLERPASVLGHGTSGGDAQTRVANTLMDLRRIVTDLDPKAHLTGAQKLLKWFPNGNKIDRYFTKYQSGQSHLNAIIKALGSGQDELRKDNADIEIEKANMWTTMGKLSEYNMLAHALDSSLGSKIAELNASGRTNDANTIRADALFPVRQRQQDIVTQMAVNMQGYLALDLVRRNNIELIRGVDSAQSTTIAALRTAVIVSQALSHQQLVLDQIGALNKATSGFVESTPEQLRTYGAQVEGAQSNQQAATSSVEVARLQAAFDNVFATMDALDAFRAQAVASMAQTVTSLEGRIERTKPYLEPAGHGEA